MYSAGTLTNECLLRTGKTAEAALVAQQLKTATAPAGVPIRAWCLCRPGTAPPGPQPADGCCH
ncbi:hypothetical protein [Streptomyces sp. NPDC007991]|uniref:hypothetical protein n=1 Tax=Streptomyces sp. NPDC007991 TaxID=3364803 RepID=UPI0036E5DFB5